MLIVARRPLSKLSKLIDGLNGAIKINFDTGKKKISHNLSHANEAILVEGVVWRDIEIKKKNSIILILASEQYRKSDYIKNKIDFSKFIKNKNIIVKYNCLDRCHKELNYKFLNAFENILSNNKYILANEVQRFEKKFAEFSNAKYAATCGNGYDALVLLIFHSINLFTPVLKSVFLNFLNSLKYFFEDNLIALCPDPT